MPRDKTITHEKILPAARKEFLEKGFAGATMRDIAARAGITAAGLYRHFADKEAMFAALVEPTLEETNRWYMAHRDKDYAYLNAGDLESMWNQDTELHMMMGLVYEHFDVFKLLICCSTGTKYAHFMHRCVELEEKETLDYMNAARAQGVPVRDVPPKELHLLMSAYVNALFEVVVYDFTREEAAHYLVTMERFFTPGWREILGL